MVSWNRDHGEVPPVVDLHQGYGSTCEENCYQKKEFSSPDIWQCAWRTTFIIIIIKILFFNENCKLQILVLGFLSNVSFDRKDVKNNQKVKK